MNFSEKSFITLQKALSGDDSSWDELFQRYWPLVAGVATSTVKSIGSGEFIDDIVQNVFLHLVEDDAKRLRQYNPKRGTLESYIAKIAHFRTIDLVRSHIKHYHTLDIESIPEPVAVDSSSLPMLEEWEISAAMNTLTQRERHVINLLFKQELDVSETAQAMGITPETVRSAKSHALKKLKKFFGQG